ncbi:MAG TPA: RraA family protein [Acidisoma sp.]|uniref:RraA family protein n=1 Tax=Acidisoma sp. TaxID=1872115 RepID=UPI002C8893F4|nr:RraA family protein [Acidisoma sp.]HTI01773.1 RraA family protein [Acidisoma sp.]
MTVTPRMAELRESLFSALLSDCLDQVGLRRQAMPSRIRPLDESQILVGRARTGAYMEVYHVEDGVNPYDLEIALIDSLMPDEVPVFACSNPARVAPWGELLSTAAQVRGAAGAVMDGCVRDIKAIREMGFPVFHGGIAPLDSKGRARVMAIDVPVECAGVMVESGDLIFGDADGLVVVPQAAEEEVLRLAAEKLRGEKDTLAALRSGTSLREVFERYGIL